MEGAYPEVKMSVGRVWTLRESELVLIKLGCS